MVDEIRKHLILDLNKIQESKGFDTTTKTVFDTFKSLDEVSPDDCRAWAFQTINITSRLVNGNHYEFIWNLAVIHYASIPTDDRRSDIDMELEKGYWDFFKAVNSQDMKINLEDVEGLESFEVQGFYADPIHDTVKGMAYIPCQAKFYIDFTHN